MEIIDKQIKSNSLNKNINEESKIIKESKNGFFRIIGELTHKIENNTADSLEIGSVSKGGKIKVYGNFNEPKEFKAKINNAIEVQKYAQANIGVNI